MFRELVRKKQQISKEECITLLKEELRGVLSVQGDDGYPYGLPIIIMRTTAACIFTAA